MNHRKKNRPALQRRDILTVSLVSFLLLLLFSFCLLIGICLSLLLPSSQYFFFFLSFFRSLSTQLFLLVLLLLQLSMIAFSYVGLLSLFWVRLFHALYLGHLPPSSFLEELSSEQFAELGSVHLLAFSGRACSLAFLSSVSPFLAVYRAVFIYFVFIPFFLQ